MTVNVLILPGLFNSGEAHWQSQWERQFHGLQRVEQQDWETPVAADWVARLNQAIEAADSDVVLVAHSLAITLITRWAAQYPQSNKVKGALLVAPSDTEADSYPSGTTGFTPMSMQRLPFRTILVASTNDPYVTQERAKAFGEAWGSELVWEQDAGHISGDAGYGPWPKGVEYLYQLTGDPQFQLK
ncbi:serine hydrolase family protein [Pseudomonas fluorescens]|jgi:predicted alpha/beta hydrolase family esterase|uniref:Alpha/beta hydrolase n=1 Tax=Pseudomonas fluorescens TaxID=294 RepID=A0A2N1EF45_PSEFL|nr:MULTISPECIES: alpha/beta hydrolase [Pseudomonas]MBD8097741.1 serine hydrolase family protein [Pseudomonas fluorescens]MBD8773847.1 serine hydrolase family protein [Pseudomonas fluorescens]MBD8778095.1 serine hydrolase family protein [Pseudomonas fluorescens]MBD8793637.1 serine hydrolase family protein [Pseudomonas fluorescens]PKH27163.1 alpha/beta hydrolase [Pseudomonas fluorescens]